MVNLLHLHTGRYYYASLRSQRASRQRPDLDPFFLPDDLFKAFTSREITAIRALFEEELQHFSAVKA